MSRSTLGSALSGILTEVGQLVQKSQQMEGSLGTWRKGEATGSLGCQAVSGQRVTGRLGKNWVPNANLASLARASSAAFSESVMSTKVLQSLRAH